MRKIISQLGVAGDSPILDDVREDQREWEEQQAE
jgi:hypothetical protein